MRRAMIGLDPRAGLFCFTLSPLRIVVHPDHHLGLAFQSSFATPVISQVTAHGVALRESQTNPCRSIQRSSNTMRTDGNSRLARRLLTHNDAHTDVVKNGSRAAVNGMVRTSMSARRFEIFIHACSFSLVLRICSRFTRPARNLSDTEW